MGISFRRRKLRLVGVHDFSPVPSMRTLIVVLSVPEDELYGDGDSAE